MTTLKEFKTHPQKWIIKGNFIHAELAELKNPNSFEAYHSQLKPKTITFEGKTFNSLILTFKK